MQTLSLHDKITFSIPETHADFEQICSVRNRKINDCFGIKDARALTCDEDGMTITVSIDDRTGQNLQIPVEDNLITQAIRKSFRASEITQASHVEVWVEKNIPAQAGLGGGSSDAAATLQMTTDVFGLSSTTAQKIARELGSDVPFFLWGGRAKMSDTGATLSETLPSLKNPVVLVKPTCGVSTKECYEQFDKMTDTAKPKGEFKLLNSLQKPALSINKEISDTLELLEKNCGADNCLMTGSGSACFGICNTFDQARKIATLATKRGWWARACSCANIKASLID